MISRLAASLAVVASLLHVSSAQVFSECNPLNATCPPNEAFGTSQTFDWTTSKVNDAVWNSTSSPVKFGGEGAKFKVGAKSDSPHLHTNFYIFFGRVEVLMKIAPGTGIVSSIVLLSDTLDEVDIEMFGSNKTTVQSNYFGKGNTTTYDRAVYHQVPWAPQDDFHNYTLDWTAEKLEWWFDGVLYRTLKYEEAVGGTNYPQTPSQVHVSAWAAGDATNDKYTIDWAGGETDYSKGPFEMFVKSVYVKDYSNGSSYEYSDKSGSWQSIKVKSGESEIAKEAAEPVGTLNKLKEMDPKKRNILIGVTVASIAAVASLLAFWCIRKRRAGALQKAKADAEWDRVQKEQAEYRKLLHDDTSYAGSMRTPSRGTESQPAWREQ